MEKVPGSAVGNIRYTVIKIQISVSIKVSKLQSVPAEDSWRNFRIIFGVKVYYLWLILTGTNSKEIYIIPTHAYRDDEVSVITTLQQAIILVWRCGSVIAKLFDKLGVEYIFLW